MALVPHTQELQREVQAVQQLRRSLHDAYIAESGAARRSAKNDGGKPPSAMEVHRTVDAPTLNILKSPNYPFTLCEEAPPSYVPPPVPFDVAGEIDSLKQRVLQVQEDLQKYQKQHSRGGAPLSRTQMLDFFSHNATYAEMAWVVSSLQWFYRWVLTHSISHLWNCKEQLEYVLTQNDASLPQSVEEMDQCLQELPFSAAVSVLDTDRQSVVAQERRRLRSVSRTFRGRLPPEAVTVATSSYLTPEEKYMYQEFFNQSEHMLLLLNHTLMLDKANSHLIQGGGRHSTPTSAAGMMSNSQNSARGGSFESGAVMLTSDSMMGEMDTAGLAEETLNAVAAEQEVITTLMRTIRERQQRGESFDVSEEEAQHSHKAQVAVYGCVLSDMSLMGQQMSLVSEFVDHYEDWLKLRGFQSHEELMSELSKRSGGTAWPTLSIHGDAADGHGHFVPPTEQLQASYPRPADNNSKNSGGAPKDTYTQFDSAKGPRATPTSQNFLAKAPPNEKPTKKAQAAAASEQVAPASSAASERSMPSQAAKKPAAVSGSVTSPASDNIEAPGVTPGREVANAFYSILEQMAAAHPSGDGGVARAWLIATVRFIVVKMVRREWDANSTAQNIAQAEEDLLGLLRRKSAYARLTASAAALCVVAQEMARLCAARCEMRSLTAEVPVVLHVPEDADDYAQAVADVMNPVEQERWGCVLDALWFQTDPSTQSSGGLLLQQTAATAEGTASSPVRPNASGVLHFLYIESIDAPPTPQNQCVTCINLRYRLPRMSPAATSSRRVAPTLAAVSGAQPSSNYGMSRYQLARRVLAAFAEIETRGLLPCFACRVAEAATVPLSQAVFVTFDDANTSVVVDVSHTPLLCVLPPAAIELKRLYADVGAAPAPEGAKDQYYTAYASPVNFSTIGLMVGAVLEEVAIRVPVLSDLYMTASTVREQALSEIQSGKPSRCFTNATTHPIPVSCAPAKTRAISIQRESIANRNSTAVRHFIPPLLRNIEDRIAAIEHGGGGGSGGNNSSNVAPRSRNTNETPDGSVSTPRGASAQSVTGRQTQMVGGKGTTSPSPSAVRPIRP
ncbi:hypothetical protein ABB37_04423 [Leptomonas pyrrhocoris]|uniref:Uncharacterized protein n=1 Tax=Leptomonas pyrrhocoris TaxID=157538 RepID=A0A0M9G2W4_LEPPY|nr:hypothetical protein ABB37_04423 [Leptomonas pyrrhocoris]KPA81059.1 hypothetical protein ABB37_04423 [Leptomonas pyrrhocoris]|eukprot:XP_015659498.1 hypothetical protein ABB37_04423 [Leptomonas pyrrhocoris]